MEAGKTYAEALAEAQARGYAEADPTDDVSGADAAAKMAILATVAFNTRVDLDDVEYDGHRGRSTRSTSPRRRELEMVIRLVGAARLADGRYDVRVRPAFVDKQHPLAKVDGAFNAVMLQGDAIREITLEGPGAGGTETASAVIADITSVIGTMGTGFLQNDAAWRELDAAAARRERARRSTSASRSRTGRARSRASPRSSPSARSRSPACCSTRTARARRCTSSRTRRATGALEDALAAIARAAAGRAALVAAAGRSPTAASTELGWA